MKELHTVHSSVNPLALERDLVARLTEAGVYHGGAVRLRVQGRRLLIDGFIPDLEAKTTVEGVLEGVCREHPAGLVVVNRLRVAECEQSVQ